MIKKVYELMKEMERLAPHHLAAEWDNVGLQVGDPHAEIRGVMVTMDVSTTCLEKALKEDINVILSHHPLIFRPLNSVTTEDYRSRLIMEAIKASIHIFVAHTNLDAAIDGVNDQLAKTLMLQDIKTPEIIHDHTPFTREGFLAEEMGTHELCDHVSRALKTKDIRMGGYDRRRYRHLMVSSGSGADAIELCATYQADALITGDMKYHDYQRANELGILVVDGGHYHTEKPVLAYLKEHFEPLIDGPVRLHEHIDFYYSHTG